MTRQSNGRVRLQFSANSARTYIVEASTNLADWDDWQPVTLGSVPAELTDPDAGAIRFYRAVHP